MPIIPLFLSSYVSYEIFLCISVCFLNPHDHDVCNALKVIFASTTGVYGMSNQSGRASILWRFEPEPRLDMSRIFEWIIIELYIYHNIYEMILLSRITHDIIEKFCRWTIISITSCRFPLSWIWVSGPDCVWVDVLDT